jgi:hypothetical protein
MTPSGPIGMSKLLRFWSLIVASIGSPSLWADLTLGSPERM